MLMVHSRGLAGLGKVWLVHSLSPSTNVCVCVCVFARACALCCVSWWEGTGSENPMSSLHHLDGSSGPLQSFQCKRRPSKEAWELSVNSFYNKSVTMSQYFIIKVYYCVIRTATWIRIQDMLPVLLTFLRNNNLIKQIKWNKRKARTWTSGTDSMSFGCTGSDDPISRLHHLGDSSGDFSFWDI